VTPTFERTLEEIYGLTDLSPAESEAVRKFSRILSVSGGNVPSDGPDCPWKSWRGRLLDNIDPKEFLFSPIKLV
jgi:hypothetical protein